MAYSSIKRKYCRCSDDCPKMPTISFGGYYYAHAPQEIKDAQGLKAKKGYQDARKRQNLNSISRKVKSYAKENNSFGEPVNEQNRKLAIEKWFNDRRYEMTGYCVCGCGQKSSKDDNKYFRYSLAHVLCKAKLKSIATHPLNFIELAFWGGCHSTFDDKGYAYCKETNPKLWAIVVQRFKILFPCIAENEIKFIPDVLMYELDN